MKEKLKKMDKKKLMMVGGFLVLIVIILFGGAFIYNQFFYSRAYSEVEKIMATAAEKHFSKNSNELPKNYNDFITVSIDTLVQENEMKTVKEYVREEISCDGNVTVTNINGKYRYTPFLDCGDTYQTSKFIDYVKKSVPVVTSGNGLYELNDELVFRGDDVNNFVKINNKKYRIVKFSADSVVIILDEKTESIVWDNRYNVDKKAMVGINDYSVSRIREYLDDLYEGTSLLTEEDKMVVTAYNVNFGKRNDNDTDKTGTLEKSSILQNQFVGLLALNDYLNASLDQNCTASLSPSCMNYNYLTKYNYNWWLLTGNAKNTHQVYRVSNRKLTVVSANSSAYVRPVLQLTKDALYVSGNGTENDPYIIK